MFHKGGNLMILVHMILDDFAINLHLINHFKVLFHLETLDFTVYYFQKRCFLNEIMVLEAYKLSKSFPSNPYKKYLRCWEYRSFDTIIN